MLRFLRAVLVVGFGLTVMCNVSATELTKSEQTRLALDWIQSIKSETISDVEKNCAIAQETAAIRRSKCVNHANVKRAKNHLSYLELSQLVGQCNTEYSKNLGIVQARAESKGGTCAVDESDETNDTSSDTETSSETYLMLVSAATAKSDETTLTLEGIDPGLLVFSNSPDKDVRSVTIDDLVKDWDSLFTVAPNAALTWDRNETSGRIVIALQAPSYDNNTLVFPYTVVPDNGTVGNINSDIAVQESVPENMQDVRLFIDDFLNTLFGNNQTCTITIQNTTIETLTLTDVHLNSGEETITPLDSLGPLDQTTFQSYLGSDDSCSGFIKYETASGEAVSYYFNAVEDEDPIWFFRCDDSFGCYYTNDDPDDPDDFQQVLTICSAVNLCAIDTYSPIDNTPQDTMDGYENIDAIVSSQITD